MNGGVEDLDLCTAPTLAASLFDIHQNIVGTVANLQEAHVWRFQGGLQQGVEHFQVAGDNPVFGCRSQLAGDQLARVVELLTQVL
ncbi:hypothetical protein D3C72_1988560 [compost metagenome]